MRVCSINYSIPIVGVNWLRYYILCKISANSNVFHYLELFIKSLCPVRSSSIIGESSFVFSPRSKSSHCFFFLKQQNFSIAISEIERSSQPRKSSSQHNNIVLLLLSSVGFLRLREKRCVVSSNYIDWKLRAI